MKHWYLYILVTLQTFTIASCADDEVESVAPVYDADYVSVNIILSADGDTSEQATRTTPDADGTEDGTIDYTGNDDNISTEAGSSYENYINHSDIALLVFEYIDENGDNVCDDDAKFLERAFITGVSDVDGNDELHSVKGALFKIPNDVRNGVAGYTSDTRFQLVTLCNIGLTDNSQLKSNLHTLLTTENLTLSGLIDGLTFDGYAANYSGHLVKGTDSQKFRIPMFGTRPACIIPQEGTDEVDAGVIPLLRALAQVRVKFEPDTDNFVLKGVTLTNANTAGHVAPTGGQAIKKENYQISHTDNSYSSIPAGSTNYNDETYTGISQPSIVNDAEGSRKYDFHVLEEGKSYVLYIPEYRNISQSGQAAQTDCHIELDIRTKYGDAEADVNKKLYFADYTGKSNAAVGGNEWDIIRNDIYEYTITAINEGELNIRAKVSPWATVASLLGWGADNEDADGNALYTISFANADEEAGKCFICRPRYGSGSENGYMLTDGGSDRPISPAEYKELSSEEQGKYKSVLHSSLNNNSSEATFKFTFDGPAGAVWKAYLSNTDDFSLGNTNETGIARKEPYNINISARNSWYETTDADGNEYTPWQFDRRLTQYGRIWEATGGPETDFYIVVSTDGLNEFEVIINPPCEEEYYRDYKPLKDKIDAGNATNEEKKKYEEWTDSHPYKNYRQYPGTDTRIRLKQLKARCGEGYYAWGDRYK